MYNHRYLRRNRSSIYICIYVWKGFRGDETVGFMRAPSSFQWTSAWKMVLAGRLSARPAEEGVGPRPSCSVPLYITRVWIFTFERLVRLCVCVCVCVADVGTRTMTDIYICLRNRTVGDRSGQKNPSSNRGARTLFLKTVRSLFLLSIFFPP